MMHHRAYVLLLFTLTWCVVFSALSPGAPLSLAEVDYVGDVSFAITLIPGATQYLLSFTQNGGVVYYGTESSKSIVNNTLSVSASISDSCLDATFSYKIGADISPESDTLFFCIPGYTRRLAGGGQPGKSDSGYLDAYNSNSLFDNPQGFTFSPTSDIVIADRGNSAIRMISFDGVVTTLAVDNTYLSRISSVAMHPTTLKVYTVDENSRNIIQIANGVATVVTVLPCGTAPSIDEVIGITYRDGDSFYIVSSTCAAIYIFDSNLATVRTVISGSGTADGVQGIVGFLFPCSLFYDATNYRLLIADSPRNAGGAIRSLDLNLLSVTTLTGQLNGSLGVKKDSDSSQATLGVITGLTYNPNDDQIFVADHYYNSIRAIDSQGNVATLVGINANENDPAPSNLISNLSPTGIALDPAGSFLCFSSDYYNALLVDYGAAVSFPNKLNADVIKCSSVTLSWTDYTATYLDYQLTFSPGNIIVNTMQRQGVVVTGLTHSTTYTVTLVSLSDFGPSPSTSISFTTPALGAGARGEL